MVDIIGGFREGYEGRPDYDLVLRLTEKTNHIFHILKVLYHLCSFRESVAMDASAKNYAYTAGLQALNDAMERRGNRAEVTMVKKQPGCYRVRYLLQQEPKVSKLLGIGMI